MVARIATAMMISRSVKARAPLTRTINIKFDLLHLVGAAACPLRRQRYPIHADELRSVILLQISGRRFLDQLHDPVTGVHVEFLRWIRRSGRGLHLRHAIGQNLTDAILLGVERVSLKAILDRAPEREHTQRKNRQAQQHLVQRESNLTSDGCLPAVALAKAGPVTSVFISSHSLSVQRGR